MTENTLPLMNEKCASYYYKGNAVGILLLHGFTGSPSHLLPLAYALKALGYTVSVPRLPGHGTRPEDMKDVTRKEWLTCAQEHFALLQQECKRVYVGGLSMGACLSLILAASGKCAGVFLFSTPMPPASRFSALSPIAAPFMPVIHKSPDGHKGLDPEYDFAYNEMMTARVTDLNYIISRAKKCLPLVTCPLLAMQSTGDATVKQTSLQYLLEHAGSKEKDKLILDNVPHTCTISLEKDRINQAVCRFIARIEAKY